MNKIFKQSLRQKDVDVAMFPRIFKPCTHYSETLRGLVLVSNMTRQFERFYYFFVNGLVLSFVKES